MRLQYILRSHVHSSGVLTTTRKSPQVKIIIRLKATSQFNGKTQTELIRFLWKCLLQYIAADMVELLSKTKVGNCFVIVKSDQIPEVTCSVPAAIKLSYRQFLASSQRSTELTRQLLTNS